MSIDPRRDAAESAANTLRTLQAHLNNILFDWMIHKHFNHCVTFDFFQENKSGGAAPLAWILCQHPQLIVLFQTNTMVKSCIRCKIKTLLGAGKKLYTIDNS